MGRGLDGLRGGCGGVRLSLRWPFIKVGPLVITMRTLLAIAHAEAMNHAVRVANVPIC